MSCPFPPLAIHTDAPRTNTGVVASKRLLVAIMLCLVIGLPIATAAGDDGSTSTTDHTGASQSAATATTITIAINVTAAQAARAARHEYGGRILGVQLEDSAQAPYYRVKLLNGGRVLVVHITAHQ